MTKEGHVYIQNIFYMLSYAFQGLTKDEEQRIASEEFENTADLLCAVLTLAVSSLLKRGLYKEFIAVEEDLHTLRGKIDLGSTIRNYSKGDKVLTCEHDEFSEDNLFNQIILCTMMQFARSDEVAEDRKTALKRIIPYFSNVKVVHPSAIRWDALEYRTNNREYRFVINVCYFALNALLLTTDSGDYHMHGFADDQYIHRLYEKFILEYYRKEYPELEANNSQIKWNVDGGEEVIQLPRMNTDITLSYDNRYLIIDAKFYGRELARVMEKDVYHSGNLYQIYSYVKNKDVHHDGSVAGMLLYAKTEYDIDVFSKPFSLEGNRFQVLQLDLNCPFADIKNTLDTICEGFKSGWKERL